jgi:carbamoyl-phosphate synthase large subunit
MVNCNPETVSTDYDTSDKLYFEPSPPSTSGTWSSARSRWGVILQFGGQTPLKLAHRSGRSSAPAPTRSTSAKTASGSRPSQGPRHPPARGRHRAHPEEARREAPPRVPAPRAAVYVLGGRAMAICYDLDDFDRGRGRRAREQRGQGPADGPLPRGPRSTTSTPRDGDEVFIAGIIEHIEEAGVHSGDSSACAAAGHPPAAPAQGHGGITRKIALSLGVIGSINIQFAIQEGVGLRPRGQPPGQPHGPVCVEGHGHPGGRARDEGLARREARGPPAFHQEARPAALLHQGPGVPVAEVPGPGRRPRARDAVDGRGHGRGLGLRRGLRQGPHRRGDDAPDQGRRVPVPWRCGVCAALPAAG